MTTTAMRQYPLVAAVQSRSVSPAGPFRGVRVCPRPLMLPSTMLGWVLLGGERGREINGEDHFAGGDGEGGEHNYSLFVRLYL